MKPLAFFFDLDGTLIDSEMLWAKAISACLADHGLDAPADMLAPIVFGHSWPDIHAQVRKMFPSLPASSPAEAGARLKPYYARLATDPSALVIPSAVEFFRKAARIAPCAIVSGSPRDEVIAAAQICGISRQVKFVLGSEDYTRGKPAPDSYLQAASILEADAGFCVVVEDSTAGVVAGRTAGMRVLGVDRNRTVQQDFTGCTWLVNDLSEIDIDAVFGE